LVLETEQNILYRLPFPFENIRRYTLKQADWLVARGEDAAGVSAACGYQGKCTFVEYCVDKSHFHPQDLPSAPRSILSTNRARKLKIGYVGRLLEQKGLFTVLQALEICMPAVTFTLVGEGSALQELESRVKTLGLQQRVEFVKPQSPQGVATFMRSLDALVLMSETTATWKEQFGRVIIEAQACGIPVIGSSSGAIPSVIGGGGWVVPEGNAKALACLLDRLVDDPPLIAEAKLKALQNVERFSPEKVGQDLYSAFLCAAEVRRPRHRQQYNPVSARGERQHVPTHL
jgi:glycosyltransferase involved in cell wall biosynthesis